MAVICCFSASHFSIMRNLLPFIHLHRIPAIVVKVTPSLFMRGFVNQWDPTLCLSKHIRQISCLLHPPHPAGFPFLFPFHAQDGLADVQRLSFQPCVAPAFHVVRPLFTLQLAGVNRSIMAQAMGVGWIHRSLVFWENSCPQAVQIRMGVHVADVLCRVPAAQLPPVGHNAVILAVAGNEGIITGPGPFRPGNPFGHVPAFLLYGALKGSLGGFFTAVLQALTRWRQEHPLSFDGRILGGTSTYSLIYYTSYYIRVHYPGRSLHSLRHTFATLLLQETGDVNLVAAVLGDTVATVSNIYLDYTQDVRDRAADGIEAIF